MKTSQQKAEEAIEQVKQGNRIYYEKVLSFAELWVTQQMKSFSSENLKNDYYNAGNEPPAEPRVFGAVFFKLSRDGKIFKNGFEYSKNPTCHARPQTVWISKEFRLKQQKNRLIKTQIGLEL